MKGFEEPFVGIVVFIVGWFVCMTIAGGAFALGFAAAHSWGGIDPNMVGLLSAIVVIWLHEREESRRRFEKLEHRLQRLWEKATGLD